MDSCNDWEDKCAWETTAKGLPKLEIARANRAQGTRNFIQLQTS
jgi:hypothetical protein